MTHNTLRAIAIGATLAAVLIASQAHALPSGDEQFDDFRAEMARQDQAQYQRQNDRRLDDLERRQDQMGGNQYQYIGR